MRTEEEKKKHAAYMREYMRTHPEQRKKQVQRQKEYRATDPDSRKREYLRNRDAYIKRAGKYREENAGKLREYERKRYLEHPERKAKLLARIKEQRANGRNREWDAKYRETHSEQRIEPSRSDVSVPRSHEPAGKRWAPSAQQFAACASALQ